MHPESNAGQPDLIVQPIAIMALVRNHPRVSAPTEGVVDFAPGRIAMEAPSQRPQALRFGVFELDLERAELRKHGLRVKLQGKPFDILTLLLSRPGELVTRSELHEKLWPTDSFADLDHSLNAAVNKLREALGDSAENPRFIETLPRRGYRFVTPVTALGGAPQTEKVTLEGPPAVVAPTPRSRYLVAGVGAAVLVLLGLLIGLLWLYRAGPSAPGANAPAGRIVLAVLPFKNLSLSAEQDYFIDGVSEEMIAQLGSLHPERLRVIARSTVMRYKNTNQGIEKIGRELGAGYIVEGSVRRAGERVRITAQLIQVGSQNIVWAESYERDLADVLAIQREVAGSIARSLAVEVLPSARAGPAGQPARSAGYEDYLRGRFFREKLTEEGLLKSIDYFREAIAKDPNFAPAYAGFADSYRMLGAPGWSFVPQGEVVPRARAAALKALELDSTLAEAHAVLAMIQLFYDWDFAGAEKQLKRAIDINPADPKLHVWYSGCLTALGRYEEAIAAARQGQQLDPLSSIANQTLAIRYYYARRYDEAVAQFEKTLELDSDAFVARWGLGQTYWQMGRREQAIAEHQKAVEASGGSLYFRSWLGCLYGAAGRRPRALEVLQELDDTARRKYVSPFHRALVYTGLGDREQALLWLEKAYQERSGWMAFLNVEPIFDGFRDDPRFMDMLRRIGFR